MTVKIEGNNLVITIPMTLPPVLSPTGKTRSVASSHGNVTTTAVVDGKPVVVGLNAWIKAN